MDYKIFNFNLDLGRESRNAIKPVQGESAVKLRPTLTHNSQPFNLTDCDVRCLFRKPDMTYSYIDGVIIDAAKGIVEIALTNQVLLLSGSVVGLIEVTGAIGIARTWLFTMDVQPGMPLTDVISMDEFPAVEQMLIDVADIKANFNAIVAGVTVDGEVILARDGKQTLNERLNQDKAGILAQLGDIDGRIDNIVTTPVPVGEIIAQEIIDARQGKVSLGANITDVKIGILEIAININAKYPRFNGETDDTRRIKQAITETGRDAVVYLPPGTYTINDYVDITSFTTLRGAGKERTKIVCLNALSGLRIKSESVENFEGIYHAVVEDVHIDGGNIALVGLEMYGGRESTLRRVRINNCFNGLKTHMSWSNKIVDSDIESNIYDNAILGYNSNDFILSNVKFDNAGYNGLVIDDYSDSITLDSCCIQSCMYNGILVKAGQSVTLINPHIENNNKVQLNYADVRVTGETAYITTFNVFGGGFYATNETAIFDFDKVLQVNLIGHSVHGSSTPKHVKTSANTGSVNLFGHYLASAVVNDDVTNKVNDISNNIFRNNLKIQKEYPVTEIRSLTNTNITEKHTHANLTKYQVQSNSAGQTVISHYNVSNTVLEPVITFDTSNRLLIPNQIKNALMDAYTTSTRPSSPKQWQYCIDTTLGKIIWWNGTVWKDSMGATV